MLTRDDLLTAAAAAEKYPANHSDAWGVEDGEEINNEIDALERYRLNPGGVLL